MTFIKSIFSTVVYQPLYNLLIIFYVIIPDLGVAIILLTLLTRLVLMPLSKKSIESQKKMQDVQPELKKIQEKYKHDKQLQGKKVMEFYKEKGVNPAGGCLPMIVQMIFLITLYRVFMLGLNSPEISDLLYSFVKNPGHLNPIAFGFLDVTKPSIWLAGVTAIVQYFQGKMMLKTNQAKTPTKKEVSKKDDKGPDFSSMMQQQMVYMGPILTLVIGMKFASGLILYWLVTTLFMLAQQWFVIREEKEKGNNTSKK